MRDLQRICCLAIFCALFVLVRDCHLRLAGEELSVFDCDDSEDKCQLSLLQRKAQKEELEMEAQMDVADSDSESESKNGLFDDSAQVPMVAYPKNYCQHCGEMAFCHRASNPGCGGHAMGGVVSFNNHVHANGCRSPPSLTVPRSYMCDISSLYHYAGGRTVLREMLISGFEHQKRNGNQGSVWQCIHAPKHVSVRWLHLHTFCKEGKVDNLPRREDYCAVMSNTMDADRIASSWVR
ncbi:Hypothetical protein SCF082_LOCUS11038 [Durusdinium trenchii]|uniref:Uncharacterized protein n=1 Tax=Durusdinium trenchii TaxID=1381693 RepID=A0ABP0JA69_9DINO